MMEPLSHEEFFAEAVKRYGKDNLKWNFRCPSCNNEMTLQTYYDLAAAAHKIAYHNADEEGEEASTRQAAEGLMAFSCAGRLLPDPVEMGIKEKGRLCNYAGGGLFKLNPIPVRRESGEIQHYFDFVKDPLVKKEKTR